MADTEIVTLNTATGQQIPVKMVDNGDGTYSLAVSGDVTLTGRNVANDPVAVRPTNGTAFVSPPTGDVEGTPGVAAPSKAVMTGGRDTSGNLQVPVVTALGDGASAVYNALLTMARTAKFNGTAWDRDYNNTEGTLLASAARTATATAPDTVNYNARSIVVYLNVTAASGTGGLIVKVRGKDPVSGLACTLNADPVAVTATGKYVYVVGLGASGSGGSSQDVKQSTSVPLPRTFSVQVYHNDGSSYTYSVGYALIV